MHAYSYSLVNDAFGKREISPEHMIKVIFIQIQVEQNLKRWRMSDGLSRFKAALDYFMGCLAMLGYRFDWQIP